VGHSEYLQFTSGMVCVATRVVNGKMIRDQGLYVSGVCTCRMNIAEG